MISNSMWADHNRAEPLPEYLCVGPEARGPRQARLSTSMRSCRVRTPIIMGEQRGQPAQSRAHFDSVPPSVMAQRYERRW
jgi:hypothetical protein